jgi:hypothetical protein
VVAHSSVEAKYRAIASASCKLIWLKNLLANLGFHNHTPMTLFHDNQVIMHIVAYPVFHEQTKHLKVDCNYIHRQVQAKPIQTIYLHTCDQLADVFIKIASYVQFYRLLSKLRSINPLDPA